MATHRRSNHQRGRRCLAAMLCAWLAQSLYGSGAPDVQVKATVSTDTVGIDDQFQLTVTVAGNESAQAQTPHLPRLQNLKVVAGPSLSTQFQWINGQTTSSKSFIYILVADKEGQFTIDPIEVAVGSAIHKTQPITVRVTSAARAPAPAARTSPLDILGALEPDRRSRIAGDEVFMTAELDRTSAYPGQQVILSYHLYTQVSVTGLQLQENPPLTGFWVENLEVESKPTGTRRVINGKEYLDYQVKRQALFPNTAGKLKIPPSTFAVSVKSTSDFFGLFGEADTVYRKTKEVSLEVMPLPAENRPADFNNAVGAFTLTGELTKSEVAAGDAVTMRVKLSGMGNLKQIPDLPLPPMPDLTVYSSKREDNLHPVAGNQIGGEKTWEYVIVPKIQGDHTIPALAFSFFNPETARYETIMTQPIALKVTPGVNAGSSIAGLSGISKQNLTRQGTDINYIKLSGAELQSPRAPLYRSLWFYALLALPVAGNIGIFLYQRERARQSANAVWARSRKARRLTLARLRSAEKAGRSEPRQFYDQAARAFAGYLEDRFNLPDISVTADSLERILIEKNVNPETVKEAVAILQECDFGRFVSASSAIGPREELSRRIRSAAEILERSKI